MERQANEAAIRMQGLIDKGLGPGHASRPGASPWWDGIA